MAVLFLTLTTMVVEVAGGYLLGSVALLADGIHMLTHVFAFLVAYMAYYLAQKWAKEGRFTFGAWKVEVLGAYTSGILLFLASFLLLEESLSKLFRGGETRYEEALLVAFLGLGVNLLGAYLLHGQEHHRHDLNLKGAYLHVFSDAVTSLLAIGGLLVGKFAGLWFIDPLMGIVGFLLILRWSFSLMKETTPVLLDMEGKNPLLERIAKRVEESGKAKVYDIHLFKVHGEKYACIVGVETQEDHGVEHFHRLLSQFEELSHITVELRRG